MQPLFRSKQRPVKGRLVTCPCASSVVVMNITCSASRRGQPLKQAEPQALHSSNELGCRASLWRAAAAAAAAAAQFHHQRHRSTRRLRLQPLTTHHGAGPLARCAYSTRVFLCFAMQAGWSEVPNRHKNASAGASSTSASAAAASASAAPAPSTLPPFIDFVWSGQLPPGTFGSQSRDLL